MALVGWRRDEGENPSARAFLAVRRHSRFVRFARFFLPTAGATLLILTSVIGISNRLEISLLAGALKIGAEGLTIEAPRLSGSDGQGRVFIVEAERAVQNLLDPDIITLHALHAHITEADGTKATFTAGSGVYDAKHQRLTLDDEIFIAAGADSRARLERAYIDLVSGQVSSDAPLAFSSSLGTIEAEAMRVEEKKGTVTFTQGVRMTVNPQTIDQKKQERDQLKETLPSSSPSFFEVPAWR